MSFTGTIISGAEVRDNFGAISHISYFTVYKASDSVGNWGCFFSAKKWEKGKKKKLKNTKTGHIH